MLTSLTFMNKTTETDLTLFLMQKTIRAPKPILLDIHLTICVQREGLRDEKKLLFKSYSLGKEQ